jgi:RNA polymerase sigma-70 factor (ECF subfamily)
LSIHPLAAVFVTHGRELKRTALRIVGDAHRAEDLVHDAYLKALHCSAGAAEPAQPLSYAHRIVRNLAIDHQRRCLLEGDLFRDDREAEEVSAPQPNPERLAIGRQQLERVAGVLAQLPLRAQRVFELYQLEGRTQREIAAELAVSQPTVNGLLRQVQARCRAALPAD